ncbi:unnamed protein product [Eruca vesicaria subsp. sativa]|uniref:BHLH domain-containing protein n=1 Tax=Eruca vesicaria subsp. sativa TaxID=29727 RepID=A0ABC8K441_ERUVS|nr:unnamed protein product [Eruca vesicaria subsp. sativa]
MMINRGVLVQEEEEEEKSIVKQQNKESNKSIMNMKNKAKEEENNCSNDSSKVTKELQRKDYIHVRAWRGQATDSHNIAERARREKISERMKYLQALVPGCDKITSKAGTLDEIINYIIGVPGVTEALFEARQAAIAQEKTKSNQTPLLYTCGICNKSYRSSKAHEQHLKSKGHVLKASSNEGEEDKAIIKQLPPPRRVEKKQLKGLTEEESKDEWIEVDSDEDLEEAEEDMDEDDEEEDEVDDMDEDLGWIRVHKTIDKCMVHMHKFQGLFIPDIEYLKDPKGFLTYVGLKVKRDLICLQCNELCHPFSS